MSKSRLELHLERMREERFLGDKVRAICNKAPGIVPVKTKARIYEGNAVVVNSDGTASPFGPYKNL